MNFKAVQCSPYSNEMIKFCFEKVFDYHFSNINVAPFSDMAYAYLLSIVLVSGTEKNLCNIYISLVLRELTNFTKPE